MRQTKDGHLVLMHDDNVKRTTDGTGKIGELTLAELRKLHLRLGVGGTNLVTAHTIPTLEEVMLPAKGKCMVNLDKSWTIISECKAVLEKTGTLRQGIFKSGRDAAACEADYGGLNPPVLFMPIILHKKGWEKKDEQGWAQIEPFFKSLRPCAVELVFVADEDPIVAPGTLVKIKQAGARPWINTLWDSLVAGHTDARALTEPAAGWGWVVARGANIIQTDEAQRLLEYLRSRNLHW